MIDYNTQVFFFEFLVAATSPGDQHGDDEQQNQNARRHTDDDGQMLVGYAPIANYPIASVHRRIQRRSVLFKHKKKMKIASLSFH